MISPLTSRPEWREGYDSYKRGEEIANPYPEGTVEHEAFWCGWGDAMDDYEADAYNPEEID